MVQAAQMRSAAFERSVERLRHATGIVIPVYLPESADRAQGALLLRDTVMSCCAQVDDPTAVCLSVDGADSGADAARALSEDFGTSTVVAPVNMGKLHGVVEGFRILLRRPELAYFAVLDSDSDHFGNELLNFVRAAEHIIQETGDSRVMVLGRRISRHRPMGWLRGELEELADQMLLQALTYHAAVSDRPLQFEYATVLEAIPDFHSGYKLFSRDTASEVFLSDPDMAGLSPTSYYRHAVEVVMSVEAILGGARMGLVNRTTYNRQPVTTFGKLNQSAVTGDMIAWPCRRLGVPLAFVRQWLANIVPSLLLGTLIPEGRDQLEAVCDRVLSAYGEHFEPELLARRPLFL